MRKFCFLFSFDDDSACVDTVINSNLRVRYCIYGNSEKFPSATKYFEEGERILYMR